MNYVKFGNTGMDVSPVCFGCMSFGDVSKWTHEWLLTNGARSRLCLHRHDRASEETKGIIPFIG